MKRTALAIAAAAGMLLATAGTASAGKPHVEKESFSYADSSSCGAFDDNFAGSGSARTTEFDNRLTTKVITTEIDTNSVTGKSIRVHSAYTYRAYADGSWRFNGQVYIGGGGSSKLIHDTGTVRFDPDGNITKVAGPHTVLTGGLQPFCDALG
jgi:hypothetical protein